MRVELTDTTTSAVRTEVLRASQRMGGLATGVVLNLIIMTDESAQYDAIRAASQAGREHPCRVIGVIARDGRGQRRLDAEISVGESAPGQMVLLRIYGELKDHADSVVVPLLVSDTPVVTWWPAKSPQVPAADPLGLLAQRRITDAAASQAPLQALARLAVGYRPGDTDLSWTRTTNWRSLLASILDRPYGGISGAQVTAEAENPSAELMAAWLASRLRVPVDRCTSPGPGITAVTVAATGGEIAISRTDGRNATLSSPGEPPRHVTLDRRETADLLAEELRRLDPDEVYGEALALLADQTRPTDGLADAKEQHD